jgi:FixJ family two-component response regulator
VVAEQIVAGYTDKESAHNLGLTVAALKMMKAEVRCKAVEHLV